MCQEFLEGVQKIHYVVYGRNFQSVKIWKSGNVWNYPIFDEKFFSRKIVKSKRILIFILYHGFFPLSSFPRKTPNSDFSTNWPITKTLDQKLQCQSIFRMIIGKKYFHPLSWNLSSIVKFRISLNIEIWSLKKKFSTTSEVSQRN